MLYPMGVNPRPAASGMGAPVTGLPPALASLPAGSLISGTVVGREGAGQLLLRTVAGMALIASSLKLERGTVVNLRVRHGASPHLAIESVVPKPGLAGPGQAGLGSSLATNLNEALSLLGGAGPGPGLALPGDGLASAVLAFLAAMRRGDFAGWFGAQAIKALESQGHARLIARLTEDFCAQTRMTEGEWQALTIPFYIGDTVRQLRFFYRRCDGADHDRDNRFVVEVESSRLGGLQLDGLIKAARFDLVLRSHKALPDEVLRDISEIFRDGLAITGQTGTMAFQTMENFPIPPMESMAGVANRGLLV